MTISNSSRTAVGKTDSGVPVKRVLIVDDLTASADTLRLILEMDGYEVAVARDGEAAIGLAAEFRPDVAILDIGLPRMNGYELAGRLRAQTQSRHARLIAFTGYGDEASQCRTKAAGFDHHVVKPANIEHLLALVAAD
jgi:DNA-binding response OmpR family regulator